MVSINVDEQQALVVCSASAHIQVKQGSLLTLARTKQELGGIYGPRLQGKDAGRWKDWELTLVCRHRERSQ